MTTLQPGDQHSFSVDPGLFTMRGRQNCEGLFLLGHCSKFVVPTVHPRGELVNLLKLSPLQGNRLKHQTRRLSS